MISLILLGAGLLFQFFVILSGVSNTTPLNKTYFLQVDTAGTSAPRNPSRWTFFYVCGEQNGLNANCGSPVPALPFDPPRNFGSDQGVPQSFIGTHHYYYLSRFMFAFYLIALFFAALAFFTGILALCTRLWDSESMKLPRERVLALRPNMPPFLGVRVVLEDLETAPPTQKRIMQRK